MRGGTRTLERLAVVLIGVSVVVFVTMRVLPGDVALLLAGERATPEQLATIRAQLGLDQPIWVQYGQFLLHALHGDPGVSIRTHHPALADVLAAFPVTLQLTMAALAFAVAVGIPLGAIAAVRGGVLDNVVMLVTLAGSSLPVFWLGLMLLLLFGATLGWVPIGGQMPVGLDPPDVTGMTVVDSLISLRPALIGTSLLHLVLPAITLGFIPLALITRVTRSEMMETALLDHVRTARAKGVAEPFVVMRHVLRNAMIPVLSVIGLQAGLLLSGAVLTETIYSLPGVGRLVIDSILSRDYPVVEAAALCIALLFVLINVLVDIGYALLDPRVLRA